jgi:hypothetical protein
MAISAEYRAKAIELLSRAKTETVPTIRDQYVHLASTYLRLADHAERDDGSGRAFEVRPPRNRDAVD